MINFIRIVALSLLLFFGPGCGYRKEENTKTLNDTLYVPSPDKQESTDTIEPADNAEPSEAIRPGSYDFTLHWISWDKPGKVDIDARNDGWYNVTGRQSDEKGNFVSIDGELQVVSPTELRFRGIIIEKVETLNQGDTCIRRGEQVFLSTKNRKYWRLQNMNNCEGSGVVDYIDIYF